MNNASKPKFRSIDAFGRDLGVPPRVIARAKDAALNGELEDSKIIADATLGVFVRDDADPSMVFGAKGRSPGPVALARSASEPEHDAIAGDRACVRTADGTEACGVLSEGSTHDEGTKAPQGKK